MTTRRERVRERQAGTYSVPIIKKPKKKPIPDWTGGPSNSPG